jgi:predicted ribosomally synthesized peptide with SipW-like signal peptide
MQRIIIGLTFIAGAIGVIASGSTTAFFSDTETSTGNLFTAGAIDLKVDNESYYNMNKCAPDQAGAYVWQGNAAYPVPGTPCTTSWELSDLANGLLFFNFNDLKPDDEGEDTISLHVNNNDAYACMDMMLTTNDDKSSTEPELATTDPQEDLNNTWDGELAQNIQMFWWADDGDNVYEQGENALSNGVQTLYNLATTTPFSVALADTTHNVWDPENPGPLTGDTDAYIGKAWCFGTLTSSPVAQDDLGKTDPNTNGPQVRGTGVTCDGTALNNITQTDGTTLDLAFRVVQARHNPDFSCGGTDPRTAKITVIKHIVNDNGGNNIVSDYQLFVDNGTVTTPVTSGVTTTIVPGSYSVSETGISGYVASFSGDCDSEGNVTLNIGDNKTCTVTNDDLPGNITLIKNVTGTPPLAAPTTFKMRVNGTLVPNTTSIAVNSNAPATITEDPKAGYHFVSITGSAKCPTILGGTATLDEGEAITCTLTNEKD